MCFGLSFDVFVSSNNSPSRRSVVIGAGSAPRDGQWSVEWAMLQEMVNGATSSPGDGQWSVERVVLEMISAQWSGQCWR